MQNRFEVAYTCMPMEAMPQMRQAAEKILMDNFFIPG
jgi:hypothetical protein